MAHLILLYGSRSLTRRVTEDRLVVWSFFFPCHTCTSNPPHYHTVSPLLQKKLHPTLQVPSRHQTNDRYFGFGNPFSKVCLSRQLIPEFVADHNDTLLMGAIKRVRLQ